MNTLVTLTGYHRPIYLFLYVLYFNVVMML